jgi:hypothetical protein
MAEPENALLDRRFRNALLATGGLPSAEMTRAERRALDEDLAGPRVAWGALMPQSRAEWEHHRPDLRTFLPGFQGGRDLARGIAERDLGVAGWGGAQIAAAALPFLSGTRAATRAPAAAARVERGPWSPGFHDEWLAGRPPPVPRHELNRPMPQRPAPERARPRPADEPAGIRGVLRDLAYPGVGHWPRTAEEGRRYAPRQAINAAGWTAAGTGAPAGIAAWRARARQAEFEADLRRWANEYGSSIGF